jgi:pimeloyl-ACP methyl ester carboxylesterase
VLALVLLLAGAAYESAAEAADLRDYPPPGRLLDVGGHRLHIHCTGSGSPTVVVDAGLGDWSTIWVGVQQAVAATTQVCTYDRAGMGWSDPGPLPRDARQFAKELHALLAAAQVPGPYLLVGHSLGGLTVRVYAHDYPAEVAGMVLIDSMSPGQFTRSPADAQDQPASASHAFAGPAILARLGIVRLLAKPLGLVSPVSSGEQAHLARFVRPQSMQAFMDESQGLPAGAAQAKAVKTLGDLPLIVLSRGLDPEPAWQAQQSELLQLSTRSEQLTAETSGHNIEIDQPEAASAAILQMVTELRQE